MSATITQMDYSLDAPPTDEVEIDRFISREATCIIQGNVSVLIAGTGREQRNINWVASRRHYNLLWVSYASDQKFKNLVSFFEGRRWRDKGFRLYDWGDHDDWGNGEVHWLDDVGQYQLFKIYPDPLRPTVRPIYKPIPGKVKIYAGAIEVINPPLDTSTGRLAWTPETKPAGSLTWRGEFCIPARFDSDTISYAITPDDVVIWNGVDLIEIL